MKRILVYEAKDIKSDNFVENTLAFLKRFNVVKMPTISYQLELC